MNRTRWFLSAAVAGLLSSPGLARAETPAPDAPPPSSDGTMVAPVVVTAQKRSENLQSVPIAVSAYTAETRQLVGIETLSDYANFTPGLSYSPGSDRVFVRGVGRQTNIVGSDAGVATYSDGVYNGATASAAGDELFVQRTEVLRGPQGTLYGRNSIGGAVNVISRRPTDAFYAEGRTTIANYKTFNVEAAISGPVSDNVRLRLAALRNDQQEGYYKNLAGGPSEGGRNRSYYVEGQVAIDLGPRADAWIKLYTGGSEGHPRSINLIGAYDYSPFPIGSLTPGSGFGLTQPGVIQAGSGTTNPGQDDPRHFSTDTPSKSRLRDNYGVSSEINFATDWANFKYVGGYQRYKFDSRVDLDGTSVLSYTSPLTQPVSLCNFVPGCTALTVFPSQEFRYSEQKEFFSHELNISSTGDGPVQWIAGLYAYNEKARQRSGFAMPNQPQIYAPANGPANPSGEFVTATGNIRTESYAAFAQIDWRLTPTLKFTGGLRYTDDQKKGVESLRELCFGLPACGYDPATYGSLTPVLDVTASPTVISYAPAPGVEGPPTIDPVTGAASRRLSATWHATTGTAGLQWTPNKDTMAYVRYSRGYKSGGFNAGSLIALPQTDPEHVDSYELGAKTQFGPRLQVNTAAFLYDYTGLQVPLTVTPVSGPAITQFANVPKARSYGLEVEAQWAATDNLGFMLSYGYLDATIRESSAAIDAAAPGLTAEGKRLPNSPRNKVALNGNYRFDFEAGSLALSASYVWQGRTYGYIFNRDLDVAPSSAQVDMRAIWTDRDDRFTAIFYVRNLFDTLGYEDPVGITGSPPTGPGRQVALTPPRTFGVQLQYRFR